jgi:hypothetical protein
MVTSFQVDALKAASIAGDHRLFPAGGVRASVSGSGAGAGAGAVRVRLRLWRVLAPKPRQALESRRPNPIF